MSSALSSAHPSKRRNGHKKYRHAAKSHHHHGQFSSKQPDLTSPSSPSSSPSRLSSSHGGDSLRDAVTRQLNVIHNFRLEYQSVLRTDLTRLPDVQGLITANLPRLENVQTLLFTHMPFKMLSLAGDKLQHLPEFREFVRDHLSHMPEWGSHLEKLRIKKEELFESASHWENIFGPEGIHLPHSIASKLVAIPSLRDAVTTSLSTMGHLSHDICHLISDHVPHLSDVHDLVEKHADDLPHLVSVVQESYVQFKTKHHMHVPKWMVDNPYIHGGYRTEMLSFKRCFNSLFYIHNETGNIYSHLLGALLFVFLAGYAFVTLDEHWMDHLVFGVYFAGALMCLSFSTVFHTCYVHSHSMNSWFLRLDYSGITAQICGSVLPVIYLTFYCQTLPKLLYMSLAAFFGSICLYMAFSDSYREPHQKWVRVVLFIALSATALIPVTHSGVVHGFESVKETVDLFWIVGVSCPMYLLGAAVYLARFPERLFPGKFDIWFHSHQIWHCFVLAAAIAHLVGLYNMFEHRWAMDEPCPAQS